MVDRSDDQISFADTDVKRAGGPGLRTSTLGRLWRGWRIRRARRGAATRFTIFSSLTRRIVFLNLVGLVALVSGILYLNQFREGLIDARVQSLLVQGEIIASAIVASANVDDNNTIIIDPDRLLELQAGESLSAFDDPLESLEFPINPEQVAPILRRLITPTGTRARIYDPEGSLVVDSQALYARGSILRFDLPIATGNEPGWWDKIWQRGLLYLRRFDMPSYEEIGGGNGLVLPEVRSAMAGEPASIVRVNDRGELVVSVSVPIQRFRANLGALLLSTQGGDIDAIIFNERMSILRVFLVAAGVMVILSLLLASTIAGPVRKLSDAADRVRYSVKARETLPSFQGRRDEIGHLATTLRRMTDALYNRMDAIESFAADVSHELKNPLTSLRSAVETLPRVTREESRQRLLEVIEHDVMRLDRLISDISDASRLDAELAREDAAPIDLKPLMEAVVGVQRELGAKAGISVNLAFVQSGGRGFLLNGHESRLGQVFTNLLDNARSFSPEGGTIQVRVRRDDDMLVVEIEDEGPGLRPDVLERVFERFYTDRAEQSGYGNNSGLGLSISRQIIEVHDGTIQASNRPGPHEDTPGGARFTVRLPASTDDLA
ncbi:MAG: sensor histidine kinase [Hyphomicrobiales bacterium]|jgi:two-component system sensor histidine kinase ChvG